MELLIDVAGIVIACIVIGFLMIKIVESVLNLIELNNKEKNSLYRSEHIVLNKKTKKLESDSNTSLPF